MPIYISMAKHTYAVKQELFRELVNRKLVNRELTLNPEDTKVCIANLSFVSSCPGGNISIYQFTYSSAILIASLMIANPSSTSAFVIQSGGAIKI